MTAQEKLHEIENAIIARMAQKIGCAPFQMKSMINRTPELKTYYHEVRAKVIIGMAAQ